MPADPDFVDRWIRGEDELRAAADAASKIIADGRAAYAPTGPPDSRLETPSRPHARVSRLVGGERPDRLLTYPLWAAWVVVAHAILAPVLVGVIATATSLLAVPAYAIDRVLFGVPVLTFGAVAVGLLAGAGSAVQVVRSARDHLKRCPW